MSSMFSSHHRGSCTNFKYYFSSCPYLKIHPLSGYLLDVSPQLHNPLPRVANLLPLAIAPSAPCQRPPSDNIRSSQTPFVSSIKGRARYKLDCKRPEHFDVNVCLKPSSMFFFFLRPQLQILYSFSNANRSFPYYCSGP